MVVAMNRFDLEAIAHACGGARRTGAGWSCRCPVHDDRNPSLSLSYSGATLLLKCHAGCDFTSILDALKGLGALDDRIPLSDATSASGEQDYSKYARQIWFGSIPAAGTVIETYLKTRGYKGSIPDSLRCCFSLKHGPSKRAFPAMVAGVTVYPHHDINAVHRTYLLHDGSDKAPVEPAKMMLGACGGGAVRFGEFGGDTLWITEGIETGISVFLATGKPTWATLSTSGMKAVILPPPALVPNLHIAADHDEAGIEAAQALAAREIAIGRRVHIAMPPAPGQDFNDVLRETKHVD